MGFVSYLEDITERLDKGIKFLRPDNSPKSSSYKSRDETGLHGERLKKLLETANRDLARLTKLLDLATDPSVDLADEVVRLREENKGLKQLIGVDLVQTIEQFRRTESKLRSALSEERAARPTVAQTAQRESVRFLGENRKLSNENEVFNQELINLRKKLSKSDKEQKENSLLIDELRLEVDLLRNPDEVYSRYK